MSVQEQVLNIAKRAKQASRAAAKLSMGQKGKILKDVASKLLENKSYLQEENAKDLQAGKEKGLSSAMMDRLTLSDKVLHQTSDGINEISEFPDPVGEIVNIWTRPNGMQVGRMRIPLGVIGFIFESRPNVTADAGALCLKAGNAVVLRGGSEAIHSNRAIESVFREVLKDNDVDENIISLIPITDREAVTHMLKLEDQIDLIIPRGGEALIRSVTENSRIPVIKHYKGVCHLYVDKDADMDMAVSLAFNSKVQRVGVCNSLETLLVHKDISEQFLPLVAKAYEVAKVELRGCERSRAIIGAMKPAQEEDWYAEYLDLILAVKVVDSMDDAIDHIEKYGSLHTETIVTKSYAAAQKFLKECNSSSVIVNASTRMSDGYVYGLGAEVGISTTKLHSYGPMGVKDLTTTKFIVLGDGQIRE